MDFKHHLATAWQLTLKHIVPLILMTLVMSVLTFLTLGILAPVMLAGYWQAILIMVRTGREPRIQDIFSQMHLFLPLLAFFILVLIAVAVGFTLFYLPGIAALCGVAFASLYLLPLMTDQKLGLQAALKQSWEMAINGNIADHVVVVILFLGFFAIGGSVFLGILFTQPFSTIFVSSVYLERIAGIADNGARPALDDSDI